MFLELGFPKAIGCNLASLQKLLFFVNYCQIWNTLWSLIIKHFPHISVFGLNCGSNAFTALKFCYDLIIEADLFYACQKILLHFLIWIHYYIEVTDVIPTNLIMFFLSWKSLKISFCYFQKISQFSKYFKN